MKAAKGSSDAVLEEVLFAGGMSRPLQPLQGMPSIHEHDCIAVRFWWDPTGHKLHISILTCVRLDNEERGHTDNFSRFPRENYSRGVPRLVLPRRAVLTREYEIRW